MSNTFKIITTKKTYITSDSKKAQEIANYFSNVEYGKKGTFPLLKDARVAINPTYVIAIEIIPGEEVIPTSPSTPPAKEL